MPYHYDGDIIGVAPGRRIPRHYKSNRQLHWAEIESRVEKPRSIRG